MSLERLLGSMARSKGLAKLDNYQLASVLLHSVWAEMDMFSEEADIVEEAIARLESGSRDKVALDALSRLLRRNQELRAANATIERLRAELAEAKQEKTWCLVSKEAEDRIAALESDILHRDRIIDRLKEERDEDRSLLRQCGQAIYEMVLMWGACTAADEAVVVTQEEGHEGRARPPKLH